MLRIFIADDNRDMRRRIRALLESSGGQWSICGEASDGREALEKVRHLRPDIVLLDISMPQVSGLEVMRRLTDESPEIDVLVLSMHRTAELAREVIRAGARAIIDKSEAYERLNPAITALRREIHLAGSIVENVRHIGAFFQSDEEAHRILGPFICDGFDQGERQVHIIDPHKEETHRRRIDDCEIDINRAETHRQLEILHWKDAYLRGDRFDMHAMLDLIDALLRSGPPEGFPKTRLVARMEWALQKLPGCEDVVEYESRLNYLLPQFDDAVTCVYDLSRFHDDPLIEDIKRAHPALLIGDDFFENPDYLPPDQMIEDLRQRSSSGY